MIARHGYGYNLIIPERVRGARAAALRRAFGPAWTGQVRAALATGDLYVIDMSRFESLAAGTVNGTPRFTPATTTLLIRNRRTKSLTPVAIIVSGQNGAGRQLYRKSNSSKGAWLYALQAAKTSITVYGVWLGHVYHWHIVTAAMQMAMLNTLPTDHPIYLLLAPQSKFLIPFDDVLLAAWSQIAPPTSLTTAEDFLALANGYANGRTYFEDDPTTTIEQLGLRAAISTSTLLSYLPKTDTIGQSLNFYFIFAFSPPYESFIPLGGVESELFFPGGSADPRNQALIRLRNGLAEFIKDYQPDMPQRFQWPRNIET
jgi:hypothetical protein